MPVDEVRRWISDGSMFDMLEKRYRDDPHNLDLSPYDPGERRTVLKVFEAMSGDLDQARGMGIQHNGLAMCLAYCIENMQHPDTYWDYRFDE